jgi:hypothetical protein
VPIQRLLHPQFSLWPWGLAAALVGEVSFVAAMMARVYGVDGGVPAEREMLAGLTIFGAGNGFLIGVAIGDFGRMMLATWVGAFLAWAVAMAAGEQALWCGPVIVIPTLTTLLAEERSGKGLLSGFLGGLKAVILAALVAGVAAGVAKLVGMLIGLLLGIKDVGSEVSTAVGLGLGNLVLIGVLFPLMRRTGGGKQRGGVELDVVFQEEDDPPATQA